MSRMGDLAIDQLNAKPILDRHHYVANGNRAIAFETFIAAVAWTKATDASQIAVCSCGNFHAHQPHPHD